MIPTCFHCFKCNGNINEVKHGRVVKAGNHAQFKCRLSNGSTLHMSACRRCYNEIQSEDLGPLYEHAKTQWEWEMDKGNWDDEKRQKYKDHFWDLEITQIIGE